jgi:hypothetical protein
MGTLMKLEGDTAPTLLVAAVSVVALLALAVFFLSFLLAPLAILVTFCVASSVADRSTTL